MKNMLQFLFQRNEAHYMLKRLLYNFARKFKVYNFLNNVMFSLKALV
ncbi:hypothetical protein ENROMA047B_18795 [Enterobacter rongchengensis]